METFIFITWLIAWISLTIGTVAVFGMLYLIVQYRSIRMSPLKANDASVTKQEFLGLLNSAQEHILILDGGDAVVDSIYNDEEIISRIKEKLATHSNFKVYCLFTSLAPTSELLFTRIFSTKEFRDSVFIEKYSVPTEAHCKIIDGGIQAYLSWHRRGSVNRLYRTVDYSHSFRFFRKQIMRRSLGMYLDIFRDEFPNTAAFA